MSRTLPGLLRLFFLLVIGGWPSSAEPCDPNCNDLVAITVGAPTALGTTIFAPLVANVIDDKNNDPYWIAVGATALASTAGVFIVKSVAHTDDLGVAPTILVPALMGSAATFLIYQFWPRGPDEQAEAGTLETFDFAVMPTTNGATMSFRWRF